MAPRLILKTACAALTSYAYLRRFLRSERFAVAGGLLYAFSGWMLFNVFFNHFHDVAVFFPLLLLSLEKLVHGESPGGFFALMVAVCAAVNYWFFWGQLVFVVLYVILRTAYRSWPMTPGKLFRVVFEIVLGAGLAAVAVLPSIMALIGNPRVDATLTGWDLWRT
jgi:uncharacterized membrane protein YfhO